MPSAVVQHKIGVQLKWKKNPVWKNKTKTVWIKYNEINSYKREFNVQTAVFKTVSKIRRIEEEFFAHNAGQITVNKLCENVS